MKITMEKINKLSRKNFIFNIFWFALVTSAVGTVTYLKLYYGLEKYPIWIASILLIGFFVTLCSISSCEAKINKLTT